MHYIIICCTFLFIYFLTRRGRGGEAARTDAGRVCASLMTFLPEFDFSLKTQKMSFWATVEPGDEVNRSIRYDGRNVTNDVTRGASIRFMCDRRTARTVAAPLLYGVTAEPPRTAQRGSPTKLVVHCSKKFVYSANWQCAHRLGLFCSENGWCTV